MTEQRSAEEIVHRYWTSVWLERDLSVVAESYTDPTVRHTAEGSRTLTAEQLEAEVADQLRAVRGESFSIDQLTVDGDIAWLRLTLRGLSMAAMTPTVITWLAQYRIEDGRIAETWVLHRSGVDWH